MKSTIFNHSKMLHTHIFIVIFELLRIGMNSTVKRTKYWYITEQKNELKNQFKQKQSNADKTTEKIIYSTMNLQKNTLNTLINQRNTWCKPLFKINRINSILIFIFKNIASIFFCNVMNITHFVCSLFKKNYTNSVNTF